MRSIGQHLVEAWPRLFGYALTLTREPESARDLMQQSALQALSTPAAPCDPRAARAYLFRIVRHAWIDRIRRAGVRREEGGQDWPDEGFDDRLIEAIAVRQAFAALDAPCRTVLACLDVEGLTYRETAERLRIPVGTVMSRLHRA
ncbi:RNA polymerase sigma factor [Methylobacterium soli]|uniref:RNA polymerase sigma factor n=1 Tax=Methylobacterium soli TaxID=553447 RepID=A0A6L3T5R3_9HYPH|nr:RNA polymerase sigma factor [Methylobacterium soli]KAB1080673.1 RNA polymerase sigma factor [Methylobacterium soli]GJE46795.1 ECF RNA polymerase sigma factor SigH [Methylobacterium soli]